MMDFLRNYPKRQNLYYLTPPENSFEQTYLKVRELEERVYPDEWVRHLPHLPATHPHYDEWNLRKGSCERMLDYLYRNTSLRVLDLGCGNGWFTKRISKISGVEVLGADINQAELEQAARLFSSPNCFFGYGDIFDEVWPKEYFDQIILNSCIQYFPKLRQLLDRLLTLLNDDGEIHILDSPLYSTGELVAASGRSREYFKGRQVPQMIKHYHHHSWQDLDEYKYKLAYSPRSWRSVLRRKLFKSDSPFPWIISYKK